MTTLFLYEHLCAVAADPDAPPMPASWLAEGRAMRDALAEDFAALPDIELLVGETADEGEFRRLAAKADWSLIVAPETDGILERLVGRVEAAGGRLLGPGSEAVRLCGDKLRLAEWLPSPIAHPEIVVGNRGPWPQVWKPRDGAGSQDTFLVRNPSEAGALEDRGFGHLLRAAFVPGLAASVGFLCGPGRVVALVPCLQKLSSEGRFSYRGGTAPLAPALAARAEAAARPAVELLHQRMSICGYVGADVVAGDGRDVLIEINPRITTSYVGLRQLADGNLAGAMLGLASGEGAEIRWRSGRVDFGAAGAVHFSRQ